jgi:uracil phosphoribosyltransferase
MLTIIRDVHSSRQDLIFFVDRLATLLIEKALEVLPCSPKSVVTPVGVEYHGKKVDPSVSSCSKVLVFSILFNALCSLSVEYQFYDRELYNTTLIAA